MAQSIIFAICLVMFCYLQRVRFYYFILKFRNPSLFEKYPNHKILDVYLYHDEKTDKWFLIDSQDFYPESSKVLFIYYDDDEARTDIILKNKCCAAKKIFYRLMN
jgi:hypothetical protein